MKHSPYNREFWRNFEGYQKTMMVNTPKLIGNALAFAALITLLLAL